MKTKMKKENTKMKETRWYLIENRKSGQRKRVKILMLEKGDKALVEYENGITDLIDLLEYIIVVLPLIERIVNWFRRVFRRRRRKKE